RRARPHPVWLVVREAGVLRGSAVLFAESGDLAEIAVDPAARGRGIGRALLAAALEHASPGRVGLTTVDARDHALCSWLARCGAESALSQDEMVHEGADTSARAMLPAGIEGLRTGLRSAGQDPQGDSRSIVQLVVARR
ncbi:MAG: GNAT family N-acetyltransferase, partial [Actinomycetota bacterium]|nr:GNAT family N-acetyltransferase [Actinomycetota bacterium]